MAKFFIGAEELGESEQVDFADFIQLATGRSIVSGADWGGGRVEFGLSGNGMLRVSWARNGIDVRIFSTTNEGEVPSLLVELPEPQRRLPFREVEKRLAALRTLHAVVHLLEREFKLAAKKIDYCLGLAKKLGNPEADQRLRALVQHQVLTLLPGSTEQEVTNAARGLLEPPASDGGFQ